MGMASAQAATTYIDEDFEGFSSEIPKVDDYYNFTAAEGRSESTVAGTLIGSGVSGYSAGTGFSDVAAVSQDPLEIVGTSQGNPTGGIKLDLNENGIYWTFTAEATEDVAFSYDTTQGDGRSSFWKLYSGTGTGGTELYTGTQLADTTADEMFSFDAGTTYTLAIGSLTASNYNGAHIDNVLLVSSVAVPEPSSSALLGVAGMVVLLARRR